MSTRPLIACAIAALAATSAAASQTNFIRTQVDFSEQFNTRNDSDSLDHLGFFRANTLPTGDQHLGNLDFRFGPSHDFYCWSAFFEEGANPRVLDIDTDIESPAYVWTVISTFWGTHDPNTLAIEFLGSDGAFHRERIVGGVHVRDYNHTHAYTNSTSSHQTVQIFDNGRGQRLDRQLWVLPKDFHDESLASIRIVDTGGERESRAVVFAITVSSYATEDPRAEALALIEQARAERAAHSVARH